MGLASLSSPETIMASIGKRKPKAGTPESALWELMMKHLSGAKGPTAPFSKTTGQAPSASI